MIGMALPQRTHGDSTAFSPAYSSRGWFASIKPTPKKACSEHTMLGLEISALFEFVHFFFALAFFFGV